MAESFLVIVMVVAIVVGIMTEVWFRVERWLLRRKRDEHLTPKRPSRIKAWFRARWEEYKEFNSQHQSDNWL